MTPDEIRAELTDLITKTLTEQVNRPRMTGDELLQAVKGIVIEKLQRGWPDDLEFPEVKATMHSDGKATFSIPLEQHQVDRLLEEGWFLQYDITVEPEFKINKVVMVAPWEVEE